jgi:hypothetical protein
MAMAKRRAKKTTERKQVYWRGRHPKDYLLAHNPVRPVDTKQPHGVRGCDVEPEWRNRKAWRVCKCGWRPDLGTHHSNLLHGD